jgi:hypothetical protein
MTICDGGGLRRARSFAFEQFIVVSCGSTDLRWALAGLVLRCLGTIGANCLTLLTSLIHNTANRIAGGRCLSFVMRLGSQLSRTSYR